MCSRSFLDAPFILAGRVAGNHFPSWCRLIAFALSGGFLLLPGNPPQPEFSSSPLPKFGVFMAYFVVRNHVRHSWVLRNFLLNQIVNLSGPVLFIADAFANLTFALRAGFRPGRIIFGLPATRFSEKGLKRG